MRVLGRIVERKILSTKNNLKIHLKDKNISNQIRFKIKIKIELFLASYKENNLKTN